MTEEREDQFTASLQRTMAQRRAVPFERLNRAVFEERFVTPFRKEGFWSWRFWVMLGGAASIAMVVVVVNFFGHAMLSGEPFVASESLKVIRSGLWFGARQTVTNSIYPRRDQVHVSAAQPASFALGSYATISSTQAGFELLAHSASSTAVQILSGSAVFNFGKSSLRRELFVPGGHVLRITGTIVYVDTATHTVALIEGKTILDSRISLAAGDEYNLKTGLKSKLSNATRSAVRALVPGLLPDNAVDDSPEGKLFRLYGNVYSVTLHSGNRILAAKVVTNGNLRLVTLGGPLYVAENEIAQMKKLR